MLLSDKQVIQVKGFAVRPNAEDRHQVGKTNGRSIFFKNQQTDQVRRGEVFFKSLGKPLVADPADSVPQTIILTLIDDEFSV